jgi:hypothetical protein
MGDFLTYLLPIVLIFLPLILARAKWSSSAIGFTTGAVASLIVQAWDITANGLAFGPLQIGPAVYLVRFAAGTIIVGAAVWGVVAYLRRRSASRRTASDLHSTMDGESPDGERQ